MDKEIKNKFNNYEVKPPDYILENLKSDLGFAKKSFLSKYKYPIAASIIGAVVALFIVFNNKISDKITENKVIKNNLKQENNIKINDKIVVEENKIVKEKSNENKITENNNSDNLVDNNIVDVNKKEVSSRKIFIGDDINICGNSCQLGDNSNAKTGKWIAVNNVKFANIDNPKTTVISKVYGKQYFVWVENINGNNYYDTVVVNFIDNTTKLEVNQVNEHCFNSDAIVKFITNKGNYSFLWSDGIKTSNPIRNNLSNGNYKVVVTNEYGCVSDYNIDIVNTEIVNVDFYHTELYSAVNTPIYFTDRTKVTTVDKNELKYEWNFGDGTTSNSINPEHTYTKAGEYDVSLTVSTKDNCSDSYETKIQIEEDLNVIPNIFTPNGDGIHDILVINPKPLRNFKGIIFNKAGQEVFKWNNQYEGWDGNLKNGEQASEGVYYYVITGIDSDGKKFQYRSFVHLTR